MHFVLVIVVTLVISMDTLSNSQQTTDSGCDNVIERRKREPLGNPDVDLSFLDETPGISEGMENPSQHMADLRSNKAYEQNQPQEDKSESKRGRKRPKSFYSKNKNKDSRRPKPPSKPRGDQSISQEENNMKNMHHGSKNYYGSSEPPELGSEEENLPETTSFVEGRFTYGSSDSPFGMYNPRYNCFERFPRNYFLGVSSICQEERMRRKIRYALQKDQAVSESMRAHYYRCDKAYVNYAGLDETCPTKVNIATTVFLGRQKCYVVEPYQQCLTYSACMNPRGGCAERRGAPFFSSCFYDGFRDAFVWVYCPRCGFRLVKVSLPQCCSCRKWTLCRGGGHRNP